MKNNIDETYIISDMPNSQYHEHDSFSSSQIKDYITNPSRYFFNKHISKTMKSSQKKVFDIGSAVHSCWMEPDKYADEFIVPPKINRRTKAGQIEWKELEKSVDEKGQTLISFEQGLEVANMCESLDNNKIAVGLLKDARFENSVFWTDPETGLKLRIRPDIWKSNAYLADLKSCKDASIEGFSRAIYSYGYHISAAMYLDGIKAIGEDIQDFVFVCVENKEPYLIAIYTLSDKAIEIGRRQYKQALKDLKNSIDNNHWYDYNDEIPQEISLPEWVMRREQNL